MKKVWVLIIVVLLAVLVIFKKDDLLKVNISINSPTPTQKPVKVVVPEGWKMHENTKMGISFAVPKDYEIENNGDYSVLAKPPINKDYPVGDARFFYVSVVFNEQKNNETGEIYNYSPSFHNKLLAIPVGGIRSVSDMEGIKDYFMYERAGDDTFNGQIAKVFVNQRPWEFPNGTWEYRYIFEYPQKTVIAGAYVEGGPSDAPFTLPILTKIMNTLTVELLEK